MPTEFEEEKIDVLSDEYVLTTFDSNYIEPEDHIILGQE